MAPSLRWRCVARWVLGVGVASLVVYVTSRWVAAPPAQTLRLLDVPRFLCDSRTPGYSGPVGSVYWTVFAGVWPELPGTDLGSRTSPDGSRSSGGGSFSFEKNSLSTAILFHKQRRAERQGD